MIGKRTFPGPLALTAGDIFEDWPGVAIDQLAESHFENVLEASPEVILLGTGATSIFPPRQLVFAMARPQVEGESTWRKRGIDVVIAMDFSKSMLARDVYPNRLERMRLQPADPPAP